MSGGEAPAGRAGAPEARRGPDGRARAGPTPPGPGRAGRGGRTGRRPGGEDTRGRILATARSLFGERGFEGTTIRSVAAAAAVDPALVHHYFGSKQRLFVAAMEIPVDFDEAVRSVVPGPPERLGERFVLFVLHLWEAPAMRALMLGLIRSATSDPVAASMLRRVLEEGPFMALARAIDLPDARLRATLVGTHVVGLALARYVVEVEPIASATPEEVARLVGPTLQRYLTADLSGA